MSALEVGVVLYDDAEELDWAGPWEVLCALSVVGEANVFTVAEKDRPVTCAKGLRVLPDRTFEQVSQLDVLLLPGGQGSRVELKNPAMLDWLRRVSPGCQWVTSVCTGAAILAGAPDIVLLDEI